MLILLCFPGAISIIIADLVVALGYDMKTIAESNLLYDSVSTRGGEGLYSKLDAKGGSWYYILDGIASLVAGYLDECAYLHYKYAVETDYKRNIYKYLKG